VWNSLHVTHLSARIYSLAILYLFFALSLSLTRQVIDQFQLWRNFFNIILRWPISLCLVGFYYKILWTVLFDSNHGKCMCLLFIQDKKFQTFTECTAMHMKNIVVWNVMSWNVEGIHQNFGRTYCPPSSAFKSKPSKNPVRSRWQAKLISCLICSSNLNIQTVCSSALSVDFSKLQSITS
jgi:hypothetical protein